VRQGDDHAERRRQRHRQYPGGLRTLKPAEFVIIKIQQIAGDIQT